MTPQALMLLTFLAVVLGVLGIYSILSDLFLRDRSRFNRRIDEAFRERQRDQARKSSLFKDLEAAGTQPKPPAEKEPDLRERLAAIVEQSGLHITLGQLFGIMVLFGVVAGLVAFVAHGPAAAAASAVSGAAMPWSFVWLKRKARQAKLLAQLPDTFDLMARVLRAGQTVPQAMQAVADEFDAPVAAEFSYCYEQQNLGLSPEIAYRDLARRTGLLEMKIFVLAMIVQQQSGGNLSDLLEKLAALVRERFRMRGKIRALTAEGKFQAAVLLALPPMMLLLLGALNRSYIQVLFEHSNLLIGMFVCEGLGALWIRKIINFDF
jgi:tight adherence protein B